MEPTGAYAHRCGSRPPRADVLRSKRIRPVSGPRRELEFRCAQAGLPWCAGMRTNPTPGGRCPYARSHACTYPTPYMECAMGACTHVRPASPSLSVGAMLAVSCVAREISRLPYGCGCLP